jgi:hypothetical protein
MTPAEPHENGTRASFGRRRRPAMPLEKFGRLLFATEGRKLKFRRHSD